jgi:glucosamine--fructose-6-phosphate aminotransferase (isomerizing)
LALADPEDQAVKAALACLRNTPSDFQKSLEACELQVQALLPQIKAFSLMLMGGTLGNYGVALEGALKMQEASGLTVVGNETGNMLHGPWGVIGAGWLVALLVSPYDRALCEKTLGLAGKTGARRLVITEPGVDVQAYAEHVITLPVKTDVFLSGLIYLAPVQLLTYYWAVANGLDPDSPANMQAILDAMLPAGRQEPEMRKPAG